MIGYLVTYKWEDKTSTTIQSFLYETETVIDSLTLLNGLNEFEDGAWNNLVVIYDNNAVREDGILEILSFSKVEKSKRNGEIMDIKSVFVATQHGITYTVGECGVSEIREEDGKIVIYENETKVEEIINCPVILSY